MPAQTFDTIGSVLENPDMALAFKEHLKTEFSVENIEFHEVTKQFAKDASDASVTDQQLKAKASQIYDKYIKPGSDQQVNLPSHSVNKFTDALKGASTSRGQLAEAMGGTQKEIVTLMNRDSFPRFQRSAPFKEAVDMGQKLEQLQARERQLKLNPSMGDKAKAMVTSGGMVSMIRDVERQKEALEQQLKQVNEARIARDAQTAPMVMGPTFGIAEPSAQVVASTPPRSLEQESAPLELEEGVVGRGRSNAGDVSNLPKPEQPKPSVREAMGGKDAVKVGQEKSLGVSASDGDASKPSVKDKIKFFEQASGGPAPPKRGVK